MCCNRDELVRDNYCSYNSGAVHTSVPVSTAYAYAVIMTIAMYS